MSRGRPGSHIRSQPQLKTSRRRSRNRKGSSAWRTYATRIPALTCMRQRPSCSCCRVVLLPLLSSSCQTRSAAIRMPPMASHSRMSSFARSSVRYPPETLRRPSQSTSNSVRATMTRRRRREQEKRSRDSPRSRSLAKLISHHRGQPPPSRNRAICSRRFSGVLRARRCSVRALRFAEPRAIRASGTRATSQRPCSSLRQSGCRRFNVVSGCACIII